MINRKSIVNSPDDRLRQFNRMPIPRRGTNRRGVREGGELAGEEWERERSERGRCTSRRGVREGEEWERERERGRVTLERVGFDGRGKKYMYCIDPVGIDLWTRVVAAYMGKSRQNPTEAIAMQFNGTFHPQHHWTRMKSVDRNGAPSDFSWHKTEKRYIRTVNERKARWLVV